MSINRETDVIRSNNNDYVNINSDNRFIKHLVDSIVENIYSFDIAFRADDKTSEAMKGTYWMNVSSSNNYPEDVSVVEL